MTAFPDTKQQKIRLTKTVRRIFVDKNLVAQLMIHQIAQRVHSSSFIAAIGDQSDDSTLHDAQTQHTQQALGVDTALLLFHPDAALELVGLLDKIGGGSGVQADLVMHGNFLRIHYPFSFTSVSRPICRYSHLHYYIELP